LASSLYQLIIIITTHPFKKGATTLVCNSAKRLPIFGIISLADSVVNQKFKDPTLHILHALLHYLVKSKIAKINKPPYHTQLVETVVENILLS